jgi:putative DNA primase/helicase
MSTNHLPKIAGNDEGIWRRVKLIPFTVDLRNVTKPIPDFDKLLFEEEGSGILNWLLRGFMDWKQNGFSEPEKVLVAIDDYRQEEDVLTAFIEERCVLGKAWQATSMELYEAYKNFARVKGEVALSTTAFGRQMGHRQFEKRQPTAGEFRRKTLYLGIGLRDDECDSTLE